MTNAKNLPHEEFVDYTTFFPLDIERDRANQEIVAACASSESGAVGGRPVLMVEKIGPYYARQGHKSAPLFHIGCSWTSLLPRDTFIYSPVSRNTGR